MGASWSKLALFAMSNLLLHAMAGSATADHHRRALLESHIEDGNFEDAVSMLVDGEGASTSSLSTLINFTNSAGYTLLQYASSRGDALGAATLLQRGADPHVPNDVINGFQALHWAASNGFQDVVETLLEHEADLEAKDFHGRTPLALACERGHESIALTLISHGAMMHEPSGDLKTPLHYAAFSGVHSFLCSSSRHPFSFRFLPPLSFININPPHNPPPGSPKTNHIQTNKHKHKPN